MANILNKVFQNGPHTYVSIFDKPLGSGSEGEALLVKYEYGNFIDGFKNDFKIE